MKKPIASVVIPVYNGEKYILETIESVKRQTYDNVEIIVVDDGSIDRTRDLAENAVSIYVHQDNKGVAAARNVGIEAATGEYLAFIDADDKWDEKKLEKQIDFMESNPQISYTFTNHTLFLDNGMKEFPEWIRKEYEENEMTGYIPSALVVRREAFDQIGSFNETFKTGEDSEWFLRARDLGFKMAVIPENLLLKRIHGNNLTSNAATIKINLMKAVKSSIMLRKQTRTSVVIPVYNGEKYLGEAVESILNQHFKPCEIIVVDDGSTDGTEAICKVYGDKIIYLKQANQGAAAARNLGVDKASGTYLAFLDADDLWTANRLRDGITGMLKPDSADILFGMSEEFYSPDTDEAFRKRYKCSQKPMKGIHPDTMLIKREAFLKVGYFSTEYATGEFIEWFTRAEATGLSHRIFPFVHMKRRIHYTNHGIVHKANTSDYAKIVKEMLKRKREMNHD
jgi:glycosyltransferase involved in cell wall biosynthesis